MEDIVNYNKIKFAIKHCEDIDEIKLLGNRAEEIEIMARIKIKELKKQELK